MSKCGHQRLTVLFARLNSVQTKSEPIIIFLIYKTIILITIEMTLFVSTFIANIAIILNGPTLVLSARAGPYLSTFFTLISSLVA